MSILVNSLFFLPVHQHSRDAYYQKHEDQLRKSRDSILKLPGYAQFDPDKIKFPWEERLPPCWKFNDTVGFLDVGMDEGSCLTADIYLKRKHFPLSARERQWRRYFKTLNNHEFLYYWEVPKVFVDVEDNDSYLSGLKKLVDETNKVFRKRKATRNFQLWLFPFDFSCFNFVGAYKQVKNRSQD